MRREPDERPETLEYRSSLREPSAASKLDALAAAALTVSALSTVVASFPSGMSYQYKIAAGICGAPLGLVLGVAALARLRSARRSGASNIAAAASAVGCAAVGLCAGLLVYFGMI